MSDTFRCDECGREWPRSQLKEVFVDADGGRQRRELCPECLDRAMDSAGSVYGVPGETKRRAAHVTDGSSPPPEEATGRRE